MRVVVRQGFYSTLKIGEAANIMLGNTVLNGVQTYRYLGHITTNNLSKLIWKTR